MTTATLSSKGQITIPVSMRRKSGLKPKDKLDIRVNSTNDAIEITKAKTIDEVIAALQKLKDSLPPEAQAAIKENAGKTVNELRDEYMRSPKGRKEMEEKYFNYDY